ncbi:hypothetical protein ABZ366_33705, partial [Streptomyces sp. NPDC005904]
MSDNRAMPGPASGRIAASAPAATSPAPATAEPALETATVTATTAGGSGDFGAADTADRARHSGAA